MTFGILDHLTEASIEREVLGPDADIRCLNCGSEADLPRDLSDLHAIMVWHYVQLSAASLERLTSCRVIVRVGVGFDTVDIRAAGAFGIPVVNIPDYGTNDVADHVMAILLSLTRRLPVYHDALRNDPVCGWVPAVGGEVRRLTGAALGIVGLGRIGTAVAARARAFGMRVRFYDPYLPDGYEKSLQVERLQTLPELAAQSDYLSMHVPLTPETDGMIDDKVLESARPGLTLINTARGRVVRLDAVYRALLGGRLRAFGADVLEDEPPLRSHPLIEAFSSRQQWIDGRVLLTPHAAFYAEESRREMRQKAAARMRDAVTGVPLRNCVNFRYLRHSRVQVVPVPSPPWDREIAEGLSS